MSYYFFTDVNNLEVQANNGFGPSNNIVIDAKNYEQFLITSKHIANIHADAIAICNGQLFVQEQSNTDLLNIIFKPSETQPFFFPKIKYFVYRGIRRDSLIQNDGILVPKGNNDLVDSIWNSIDKLNIQDNPTKIILGLHPDVQNLADETELDEIFLSIYDGVQFWNVQAGSTIGKFDKDSIGFEVVLDTLFYKPSLTLARSNDTYIRALVLTPTSSQKDFFESWHDKESIINFIDPCAFFGGFYNTELYVVGSGKLNKWKGIDLYVNLIALFLNKSKSYIDIRNEFNFSLNYFKNYGVSETNNLTYIKVKKARHLVFDTMDYYLSKWPLLIIDERGFDSISNNFQTISLQLPTGNGDNPAPLMYFDRAYLPNENFPSEYEKDKKFKHLTVEDNYCEELSIGLPWLNDHFICSYTRLKYNKRRVEPATSDPLPIQMRKIDYLDALFPIRINFDYVNSRQKIKVFDEQIYLDINETHHYEGVVSLAISFDSGNVTLFANPVLINTTENQRRPLSVTGESEFSLTKNYLYKLNEIEQSSQLVKTILSLSGHDTEVLEYKTTQIDVYGTFSRPDLRNIVGINITSNQWEDLLELSNVNFLQKYPIYVFVSTKTQLEDDNGISYTSLQLSLKGFKLEQEMVIIREVLSTINLITYGIV